MITSPSETAKAWIRGITVALLVFLVVIGVWGLIQTHSQGVRTNQAVNTICTSGNTQRGAERKMWDHVIGLIDSPQTPPGERQELSQLRIYAAHVFMPRNCIKLITQPTPPGAAN